VTLDPGNDTSNRLLDYKTSYRLPVETWHLLRAAKHKPRNCVASSASPSSMMDLTSTTM